MRALIVVIAATALAASAQAQTAGSLYAPTRGYTYFNRPGATLEEHHAALQACHEPVSAMRQAFPQLTGAATNLGLAGAVVETYMAAGMQIDMQYRALFPNFENCMVVRGWRVVRLEEEAGEALEALDREELSSRLTTMVGAETPQGEIARVFGNNLTPGAMLAVGGSEAHSLSLKAAPPETIPVIHPPARVRVLPGSMTREQREALTEERRRLAAEARVAREHDERAIRDIVGPAVVDAAEATSADDVAELPQDATLIVVRMHGRAYGSGLAFARTNSVDDQPASFTASVPTPFWGGEQDKTYLFAVPPGQWRISVMTAGTGSTTFCMGAPTFEVGAGEVVFAGSFMLETSLQPDLALAPGQAALTANPALAERMRAASYTNGSTFACGAAAYLYALEMEGAPFRPDYAFGSRATPTPDASAQAAPSGPATGEGGAELGPPPSQTSSP